MIGRLLSLSSLICVNLRSQNDKRDPPRDAIPHSLSSLWIQFALGCYRLSLWVCNIRLDALPSLNWALLMYLQRKWYMNGEVEENEEDLIFFIWECNGFHILGISETHAVPFFDTYLGRIEWDSAPLGSISTSISPHLILAVPPTPEHLRKIHKAATKSFTSQRPTRLVNTSIAPFVSQERNIQSCNVPHTGLVPIFSHINLEDGLLDEFWFSIFGRMSMIWDGCVSELNNRTAPLLNGHIRATFQAVGSSQSFIYSSSSLLFCSK